jgi:hypothetical protein
VDIEDYGKNNNASVYNNSRFNKKLQAGTLTIPEPAYLPGKIDCKMPFVLVGDEAFALSNTMIHPYGARIYLKIKRYLTIAYHELAILLSAHSVS